MKQQFKFFSLRWILNSFGIWLAIALFGTGHNEVTSTGLGSLLFAGLIFSIVNTVLRPVVIVLSLPAILLTLGLFTLVVNGFMVWLSFLIAPGIQMTFENSIFTGMLLSLLNYIVSSVFELQTPKRHAQKEEIG